MNRRVLLAVDDFTQAHRERITRELHGWALLDTVAQFAEPEVYVEKMRSAQVVIGWPQPEWVLSSPVEYFQLGSAGYDAYVGKSLGEKHPFTLCNARGVYSIAVAEHCLAMMLALARRIPRHVRDMDRKRWQRQDTYTELFGSTVCVVGLGNIGTEIVKRCLALGMKVIGVRKDATRRHELVSQIYAFNELPDAVSGADHVVAIFPANLGAETVLNAEVFAAMKSGACFYNLARGSLVDDVALVESLQSGHLGGAGLDVFAEEPLPLSSPLWNLDNVIVTPHAGGRSVREFDRLCDLFVTNLQRYRQGELLMNAISSSDL